MRAKLSQAGWKEETATLQPMLRNLSFKKDRGSLSVIYVDTGLLPAEITISAVGAAIETTKASPK